ncbi:MULTISPECIES: DUF1003 domain-containing protein [unclassified Aeromicrobium]|uniref:DUF1003 domain-containing protein n=1 Tax=unclassified Aeromicrobium TaxID=2633570 RepID=UPI00396B0A58
MADRERLDQPRDLRRGLRRNLAARKDADPERFGRFAESAARFLGTATFIAWMTLFIFVWIVWNVPYGPDRPRWDEYPFIFLTLILSLQASYAAPLILLAQNRQEARDRIAAEQDREAASRSHADMEFLAREVASLRIGLGEVATRDFLRSELRGFLAELDKEDEPDEQDRTRPDRPSPSGP